MNTNENKQETAEQENTAAEEAAAKGTAEQAAEDTKAPEETAEEKLQKQLDELNDRYMRMAAEYDNYRKRVAKERDMIRSEATGKALSAILPIYDNLERALAQETEDTEYKKGVHGSLNPQWTRSAWRLSPQSRARNLTRPFTMQ